MTDKQFTFRFWVYLKRLFRKWSGMVGSVLLVAHILEIPHAINIYDLLSGHITSELFNMVYFSALLLLLLFAGFRVWEDEYKIVSKRNKNNDIYVDISKICKISIASKLRGVEKELTFANQQEDYRYPFPSAESVQSKPWQDYVQELRDYENKISSLKDKVGNWHLVSFSLKTYSYHSNLKIKISPKGDDFFVDPDDVESDILPDKPERPRVGLVSQITPFVGNVLGVVEWPQIVDNVVIKEKSCVITVKELNANDEENELIEPGLIIETSRDEINLDIKITSADLDEEIETEITRSLSQGVIELDEIIEYDSKYDDF